MTYPLSQIEGMTAFAASKLKKLGIRTTEALLEAAHTAKRRKDLSAKPASASSNCSNGRIFATTCIPGMGKAKTGFAPPPTTVRDERNPSLAGEYGAISRASRPPLLFGKRWTDYPEGPQAAAQDYLRPDASEEARRDRSSCRGARSARRKPVYRRSGLPDRMAMCDAATSDRPES